MKNLKTLNSIIAILITSGLVACGGGSPSSSDDKPDSLLPPDLVLSSSSSSVASSDGSNSSSGGIVKTSLPIYENFEAIDIDNFLTANYKNLSTDTSLPFYYATSGYPLSTIPNGVPRILLTNWTSNALWFGNARFTLGQTRLEAETTTADPTVATWGELDLSRPYRLSFCVKDTLPSTSRRMMIFVDNNTSAQINSIHGNSNRIMYETTSNLTPGTRYSIESSVGTSTSFLQMRVESATDVIIDDLLLEYQDTPYTGAIPTCTADNSFVRPVATSSSVASSSAPSSSEAASSSTPTTSSSSSSSSEVVSSSSSSVDGGAASSEASSSSSAAAGSVVLSMNFNSLAAGMTENVDSTFTEEVDAPTSLNTAGYAVKLIGKLKINTTQNPPSANTADASVGVVQFSNGSTTPGKVIIKQVQCPFTLQVKHAPSSNGDATRKLRITVGGDEVYYEGNGEFQIANVTPSCTGTVDVEAYGWDGSVGKGVRIFDLSITQ